MVSGGSRRKEAGGRRAKKKIRKKRTSAVAWRRTFGRPGMPPKCIGTTVLVGLSATLESGEFTTKLA